MLYIILTVNYCQLLLTVPSEPVYKRLKESEWELWNVSLWVNINANQEKFVKIVKKIAIFKQLFLEVFQYCRKFRYGNQGVHESMHWSDTP